MTKQPRKKLPREDEFAEIFQEMLRVKNTHPDYRFGQIVELALGLNDLGKIRDEDLLEEIKKI
jgi:hypothetical protein